MTVWVVFLNTKVNNQRHEDVEYIASSYELACKYVDSEVDQTKLAFKVKKEEFSIKQWNVDSIVGIV